MSSDIAISVKNISKCYFLYDRPQDRLKQSIFRRRYYREFWALKDVSFAVKRGETVGIIGRNGSGKSTLLQIIAGTLTPTSGEVQVNGRIAALLELGSGFNPDFTGRENVLMNGAILGVSREEMNRRFDEIADFADIGEFIEQPVKTYSSGMAVRLAFAVQAMVPKEVLIVDEALAVGDELFQRKCFSKIEEFKKQGGTILFVSHNGGAVVQLCDRAILLDEGEQLLNGHSKQVVNLYQKLIFAPLEKRIQMREELKEISKEYSKVDGLDQTEGEADKEKFINSTIIYEEKDKEQTKPLFDPQLIPRETIHYESRGARIFNPQITTIEGEKVNLLVPGKRYIWTYQVEFSNTFTNVRFGMLIKTISGLELGGAVSAQLGKGIPIVKAGSTVRVEFEFTANLAPGTYFLNAGTLGLINNEEVYIDRCIDLGVFKVLHSDDLIMTSLVNFNIIPQIFGVKKVEDDSM